MSAVHGLFTLLLSLAPVDDSSGGPYDGPYGELGYCGGGCTGGAGGSRAGGGCGAAGARGG